jgi:hypothetical protein
MTLKLETKHGFKEFTYDSCFGGESTQEEVFEDTKRLGQSAMDGFNVCIFAYGQTGSGKTFTIQGAGDKLPGITPRMITELFDLKNQMDNFQVTFSVYMVELYLDHLRDLLVPKNAVKREQLDIKENAIGQVYVAGALVRITN